MARLFSVLAAAALSVGFASTSAAQTTPVFSRIVVFGDSLSDVGNLRARMEDRGVNFPGGEFNYSDGRFTNSSDTNPASQQYFGVWHEQLARMFSNLAAATASANGGYCYAFGGATTESGTQNYTLFGAFGADVTVTIDNMGKQIDDFINAGVVDPNALYAVWGGGNDLFDDHSPENVTAAAARVSRLVSRLADAGARHFIVPNVPPLGGVPRYGGEPQTQDAKNRASADFRALLDSNLDATAREFASRGISLDMSRLDIWSLFIRFVADPSRYGFKDSLYPSQGQDVNPDTFLFWDDIHPTTAGHYQIAVEANRVLSGTARRPGRAVNLSTRVAVGGGENVSVGGFIITGTQPKRVILRGLGPSLNERGVGGALPDPTITLFDANEGALATNNDWMETQAAEITATGLAPTNSLESAIVRTLAPGSYTVRLSGAGGTSGIGLVEIYDLNSASDSTLANVSTRGAVGTGDNVMIAGTIIRSGGDPIIVVRAIGPSLANAGISGPLQDPTLELYNSNGEQIATNDDWRDGQPTAAKATLLNPADDREAVIVASVAPGNYTAVVRGKNNTTGVALVEVYRIP